MAFYTGGTILPLVPRIIETKGGDPVRAQRLERREGDSAMRCSKCGAENPDRARFCIVQREHKPLNTATTTAAEIIFGLSLEGKVAITSRRSECV